jgi:hypothetical protein
MSDPSRETQGQIFADIVLTSSQKEAREKVLTLRAEGNKKIAVVGISGIGKTTLLENSSGSRIVDIEQAEEEQKERPMLLEETLILVANPANESSLPADAPRVIVQGGSEEEAAVMVRNTSRELGINLAIEEENEIAKLSLGIPALVPILISQSSGERVIVTASYLRSVFGFVLRDSHLKREDIPGIVVPYLKAPVPVEIVDKVIELNAIRANDFSTLKALEKETDRAFGRGDLVPLVLMASESKILYTQMLFEPEEKEMSVAPPRMIEIENGVKITLPKNSNFQVVCPSLTEEQLEAVKKSLRIRSGYYAERISGAGGIDNKYLIVAREKGSIEEDQGWLEGSEIYIGKQGYEDIITDLLKLSAIYPPDSLKATASLAFETHDHHPANTILRTYAMETLLQQIGVSYFVVYGDPRLTYSYDSETRQLSHAGKDIFGIGRVVERWGDEVAERYIRTFLGKKTEEYGDEEKKVEMVGKQ